MYVPKFENLLETVDSLGMNNDALYLFPDSFGDGLCMKNRYLGFRSIFRDCEDVPFLDGVLISSIGEKKYSGSNRDYLGFVLLDYGLDFNFITPIVAQSSTKELVLDCTKGFSTNISDFSEVLGLENLIRDIQKIQKNNSRNFLKLGSEFLEDFTGFGKFEDEKVEELYLEIDKLFYSTRYR